MTLGDRQIEMTEENFDRLMDLEEIADIFRDPDRQRLMTAAVMARAISNQEVFELVMDVAHGEIPEKPEGH